jgi:hypothetical protein
MIVTLFDKQEIREAIKLGIDLVNPASAAAQDVRSLFTCPCSPLVIYMYMLYCYCFCQPKTAELRTRLKDLMHKHTQLQMRNVKVAQEVNFCEYVFYLSYLNR